MERKRLDTAAVSVTQGPLAPKAGRVVQWHDDLCKNLKSACDAVVGIRPPDTASDTPFPLTDDDVEKIFGKGQEGKAEEIRTVSLDEPLLPSVPRLYHSGPRQHFSCPTEGQSRTAC